MKIQHVRHATFFLYYSDNLILVDPVLSPLGGMTPIDNSPNPRPNPLVALPENLPGWDTPDALLVTHTHRDHFDTEASRLLHKDLPLVCQPADTTKFRELGFTASIPVETSASWRNITFHRAGGQHGKGELAIKMGPVSGFILQASAEPTLYIAGDTIWCPEVEQTLAAYQPDVIVLFAGAAQFLSGDPITMGLEDIRQVAAHAPSAQIIVVHMEAFNHCLLSRAQLSAFLTAEGLADRVHIPLDGSETPVF